MSDLGGRIVILGGGHAGGSAAALLRQYGWTGPITLVGEEPIAPYQRPPLSKAWLKGEADADSLALRPTEFYAEAHIDLRLGTVGTRIHRAAREIELRGGERLPYDALILATGARARRIPLPGLELDGVLELRTAADADRLKSALGPGKRLAVVGGGYIGLEAAASARALGAEATIYEREPRVLARVACRELSTFFQDYHRDHGVAFELDARIEALVGEDGHVTGVQLADGRAIACDVALVGVGAQPNDELAREAGLECSDGVVVSLDAQTSDPAIYAIGDVTRRPLPHYDGRLWRLESVPNALEQAKQATAHLCGKPQPNAETPWFWSDQYDLKLQIAGLPFEASEILLRGDPTVRDANGTAKFAVFHLSAEGRVLAVEAINAAPEFMAGRLLIANRKPVSREKLADVSISMKEVVA